jgi:hypothetical protein
LNGFSENEAECCDFGIRIYNFELKIICTNKITGILKCI